MRKIMILALVGVMCLLPTSAAFAQLDDDDSTFYDCNPYTTLDNLMLALTFISDGESLADALVYAGEYLITCGETWVTMLLDGSFFIETDEIIPPMGSLDFGDYGNDLEMPSDPTAMNAETLEYALRLGLEEGEFAAANAYFCSKDKFDLTETEMIESSEIFELACQDNADGTITCDYRIEIDFANEDPVELEEKTDFELVNGLFCSVN